MPSIPSSVTSRLRVHLRAGPSFALTWVALLTAVTTGAVPAAAQEGASDVGVSDGPPACMTGLPATTMVPGSDWRVVVDPDHAFAVLLPPDYRLGVGNDTWYAYGVIDDAPLVPDVVITYHDGLDVTEVLGATFPEGAESEPVTLGPATAGLRVAATFEAPAGEPYRSHAYLIAVSTGTYALWRYEGFDWENFDAVACSFHRVELVTRGS